MTESLLQMQRVRPCGGIEAFCDCCHGIAGLQLWCHVANGKAA